jgi:FKBP-type peptidyl-prolyl cis-trans isomerase
MMLKLTLTAAIILIMFTSNASAGEHQVLTTEKDRINYGIGVEMARNFKRQGIEIDLDLVMKGVKDGLSGHDLLMSEKDLRKTMQNFQNEQRLKQRETRKLAGEKARYTKEGEDFLALNRTKEGVVTLPSGLQYKSLMTGNGKKPIDADTVDLRYRGTLLNGTEFDSSSGQPRMMKVADALPGLAEGLKMMPVGSKWQLFVPPRLAYGERGSGSVIGPNAVLIFELELIGIK